MSKRRTTKEYQQQMNSKQLLKEKIDNTNKAYTEGAFKYLRFLIHLLASLQFMYAIIFYYIRLDGSKRRQTYYDPERDWGGKYKFLTFLNLVVQAFYHVTALMNDCFGSNDIDPQPAPIVRKARDFIFASWAFPLALNVSLSFWVLYAFDREMIFPRTLDTFYPNWLNHVVHTNVAMMIILDMFTCVRVYPKDKYTLTGSIAFISGYIAWIHVVQHYSGVWVYPVLEALNLPLRYLLLSGLLFFTVILYFFGKFLSKTIWSPELILLREKAKNL